MALSREILRANAVLSELTDAQIDAITTLSQNDENSVIAKKTGEIYGGLDADILAISGMEKNGIEKTYDYAKRVIGSFKETAGAVNGLKAEIGALTKEKTRLEKAIADGSADSETARALRAANADLQSIRKQYNELNEKYQNAEKDHEKTLFDMTIGNELRNASAGFKFKPELSEAVTRVILETATDKVKAMNPEFVDDGKGGRVLVFKGSDGEIMRNPNNQLNPYSPAELLGKELSTMGVLQESRTVRGGGTDTPRTIDKPSVMDVSGAKTRVEAYDVISKNLLAQGLTVGSEEFDTAMNTAWKENNIMALPEQ